MICKCHCDFWDQLLFPSSLKAPFFTQSEREAALQDARCRQPAWWVAGGGTLGAGCQMGGCWGRQLLGCGLQVRFPAGSWHLQAALRLGVRTDTSWAFILISYPLGSVFCFGACWDEQVPTAWPCWAGLYWAEVLCWGRWWGLGRWAPAVTWKESGNARRWELQASKQAG